MADDLIGKVLAGRYEVLWKLGQGGLSSVYAASHAVTGRKVAIKVLHDVPLDGGVTARDMILREARLLGELQHPNVCAVLDADVSDGVPFMVLEYLDGRTLRKELDHTGPLSLERAVEIVLQVAAGLDAAHRLGIVHRDVKPDNIVLQNGVAKLLDFGIAKRRAADNSYVSVEAKAGTPAYMAPEQHLDPAAVDRRADVYGLGKVLWELLAGERPSVFDSEGSLKRLLRKTVQPAAPKVYPESPVLLDQFLASCLSDDPAARPESMRAFARRLREATGGSDTAATALPTASPRLRAFAVAGLVAVIAVGAAIALSVELTQAESQPMRVRFTVTGQAGQAIRFRGARHLVPYDVTIDATTISEAVIIETPGRPDRKVWLTLDADRRLDAQSQAP